MSDQVNVGDYSLEISGDEVIVRDESGAIVETVDLDDVDGELTLPDGQTVDLASILAGAGVENFQTAAGPANDNLGSVNGGSGNFTPFHGAPDDFGGLDSAGSLGGTSLGFDALNTDEKRSYDPQQEAPVLVTWSPHDPWSVAENQTEVSFGKLVNGNPADFKFEISDDRFEIVDGILQLRDGVSFDYETESGIELEITATSRTGDRQTLSVDIAVTDVNEAQTDLLIDASAANENVASAVIGNVSVLDPDGEDDQSFQVSDNRFEIVDGQLKLKDGVSLDHENEPTVDVTVTATDDAGNQITRTFTINVADVNEAPVDIDLSGNALVENVAGAVIGALTAIDPDAADSHSFEVSDPRFEVAGGQLKLKDGQSIDFETEPSLDVVVTATDSAGNKVQETFTLTVGGVNEAQTALTLDQLPVSENVAGAIIGTLTVADQDAGDTQSFEVSDSRFEVVDGQLKLKDGVSLDRESEPTVNVQVTATDSAGHQIQQTFTINVGDLNEGQTGLALAGNAVTENAAGAVIGALTVTDPDAADSQSFQVSDARFEVVDGQLKLKDGVSLNHEAEPTVNVEVTATDAGGNQIAQTFTINVGDVNEAQTSISLSKSSVAENAKGAVVGTVLVVDPDAGDKQGYSVSDSRFQIVNGQLKLKSGVSINYEAEPEVDVTVTAKDSSGHQISQTFTIDVTNVNEKQTGMTLSATKVTENDKGAVIGTLNVSDPDAGDVQSYKVSDNRFEVVDGQLKLKDGVSLNYESAANVNVKVTAIDSGGNQIVKTFTVNVQNVNEAQTAMTLTGTKVAENAAGAVIGTLKVTDPDKGDSQSLSVSDNRFEIVNGQLKLKDGVSLNYEEAKSVKVGVTATDSAGHQITKTFTISVGNVNEAQTAMTLSANGVKENAAGAVIGTLKVTDPDAGDKQSFTVSDPRFEVVSGKLQLKPGVSLDYEQGSSVNVDVTATDKGGNQITKTFTINVGDLNEAQTALTLDNMQVSENAAGAVIGNLSVADQDAGDTQAFKVSDNRFEVVNGQLKLKEGVSFDHETTGSVDVSVTATDSAKHSITQTITIAVGDVNEAQTGISLAGSQIAENVAGAVVGQVSVTDPDAGDVQSFQVSDSRFEVVDGQLKLKDGVSLDHESEPNVDVTVTATDKGGHQIQQTFSVAVGNVNEAPLGLALVTDSAELLVNGSFEANKLNNGQWQLFNGITGWKTNSQVEIQNNVTNKASDGAQVVEMDADKAVDVIYQDVTTTAGHVYELTFDTATRKDTKSTDAVEVYWNGMKIGTVDPQSTTWSTSSFQVIGTGGSDRLEFREVGGENDNYGGLLDNVALKGLGATVPENFGGVVIGTLQVTDPDAGDSHSFAVSDSRFEVVDGQLKLKADASLNYEAEQSINVTVTATDTGGNQVQQTFAIKVVDINEAQTALTWTGTTVTENAQGAVAGTLWVADPDAGDQQSFSISDSRFEVVNNQFKLKSGMSLDFEQGSSIDVTVTATDKAGHQIQQTFSVNVDNANEASTGIQLSNLSVSENATGAVVGQLTTVDPDAGDSFGYQVSDSRFEVVGGQLQLKSGISLDHEAESTVDVKVTSTDSAGHAVEQSFAINVSNVNEAPSVTSTDGTVINHIVDTSESYDPQASETAGNYLHGAKNASLSAADISSGVSAEDLTVFAPTDVTVTFQKEGAGYHNMVGVYQFDDSGNIIPGTVEFVWLDTTASKENTMGAALGKDFLGYSQSSTVSLGTMAEGTHLGFFTIADGATNGANKTLLTNAAAGAGGQAAAMDAIASQLSIKIDANGNGHVFVGNSQLNGETFFTHNKSLNTDFNSGSDINHAVAGVSSKLPGQLLIGFEDLKGGGDQDYDDLVISVGMGTYNVNKMTQSAVQPTVDLSDVDGSALAKAVIQTSGFQAGDVLNVPPSADFNVTIGQSGADYTITIVGKTGSESLDQYEDFANAIYFSTTSKTEGDRHIDYSVTDSGGLTSNVSSADIGVANSYEISSSELANGKNTLGAGDDLLHVNTSSIGPTNMGDGYDTVHLARHGASFGHNDAVKLENVEAIDTTGYGANNVSLSINDVLNMTDGENRLTIVGEEGDSVTLTSNGGNQWSVVESNAQFTTYAYSDPSMQAVVEISNQLNAQVS